MNMQWSAAVSKIRFEQNRAFDYRTTIETKLIMKNSLKAGLTPALIAAVLGKTLILCVPAFADDAPPKEALALQLPAPTLKGTPEDLPTGPNIEALTDKPRPAF